MSATVRTVSRLDRHGHVAINPFEAALPAAPGGCAPAGKSQFFWMMQSPPAAFIPLHNLAAFSADARDRQAPGSRCPRHRGRPGV
jgi:hypothetical protein